ncbi:MAG: helix-hairpin-helix domain-containing protein [Verrucomicrobiota bacterium]
MKKDTSIRSAESDLGFVDLNTIKEEDLAQIPWIGTEKARNLIAHRPFENMEAVRKVPGITEDDIDELVRGGATVGWVQP